LITMSRGIRVFPSVGFVLNLRFVSRSNEVVKFFGSNIDMVIENFADVLSNPSIVFWVPYLDTSYKIIVLSLERGKKKLWFDKILNVNNET
jgi:hypothetical protein